MKDSNLDRTETLLELPFYQCFIKVSNLSFNGHTLLVLLLQIQSFLWSIFSDACGSRCIRRILLSTVFLTMSIHSFIVLMSHIHLCGLITDLCFLFSILKVSRNTKYLATLEPFNRVPSEKICF